MLNFMKTKETLFVFIVSFAYFCADNENRNFKYGK